MENSMEVGLKIKEMDEEARNEILSWIAPLTLETNKGEGNSQEGRKI